MAQKKWEDLSKSEKRGGIIGLIILAIIVGAIFSSASSTDDAKKLLIGSGSPNTTQPSSDIPISKETAPQPVVPKEYSGTGDDVVDIEKPTVGAAIVKFECATCTRNTVLKTNGAEALLVNEVGGYSGSHIIDVREGSKTTQLTINANAPWKVTVSGLDSAIPVKSAAVSGMGDSVLYITGNTSKALVTNVGESNFVVHVYPADGGFADLAVNTIGSYEGTVPLATPSYVQINSSGNWSVTPR